MACSITVVVFTQPGMTPQVTRNNMTPFMITPGQGVIDLLFFITSASYRLIIDFFTLHEMLKEGLSHDQGN